MITVSAADILHAQCDAHAHDVEEAALYFASNPSELQRWMMFVNQVMARSIAIANAPKIVGFHVTLADTPFVDESGEFLISFDESLTPTYLAIVEGEPQQQTVNNPMLVEACQKAFNDLPEEQREIGKRFFLSVAPLTDRPLDETSVNLSKPAVAAPEAAAESDPVAEVEAAVEETPREAINDDKQ